MTTTTHHHQLNTNTTLTPTNSEATEHDETAMAAGIQDVFKLHLESLVSFFLFSFFYYTNVYFSLDLQMDNGLG